MRDGPGRDPTREEREGGTPEGSPRLSGFERGTEWLRGVGNASDVVLSSRARLARNLAGFPFVCRASRADREQVLEICRDQLVRADLGERTLWVDLRRVSVLERQLLAERHLISKPHAAGKQSTGQGGPDEPRGVAISLPAERLSVMVNEEDHLRIQAVRSGLDLRGAYDEAEHADNEIERGIDYAFSPRFGYLTACPTNVGTGARFSVMLHLPALRMIGEIEKVKHAADDMGLAVRGYYGEGSDTTGDFFQISNQTTLGKSEGVLMHEMEHEIVPRVVEYERHARGVLLGKRRSSTEDEVHRALGTLRSARLIETDEAMQLLGRVRLGVVLGLIGGGEAGEINHLMLLSHPAHLQRTLGREISQADRRLERATLLRSRLSSFG